MFLADAVVETHDRITDILLAVDDATRFTEVLHAPANRVALSRPHRPAQRAARRGNQSRLAQDGRSHDHARVLGIDADRALARRRGSVLTGRCPWSSRPRPRYRWRPSGAWDGLLRATASSSRPPAAAKPSTWSTPATEPNPASRRTRTSPAASPRSPRRRSPPPSTRPPTSSTGRRVREQYADTGGFTDHVFAACSILGYTFVPRIRDLPSKRLYVFERAGVPKQLRPLVGGKVNADLIDRNWADILRVAATMAAGTMRPSQIPQRVETAAGAA